MLVSIGVWSGFFGPIQVLLAQQAEAIDPHHKEAMLSLVTGVGAFVSTVLNPLWGAFSDRTVLRIGRRLPWVVGGLVGGVVAMLLLSRRRHRAGDGARLGARPGRAERRCSPRSPRPSPTRCRAVSAARSVAGSRSRRPSASWPVRASPRRPAASPAGYLTTAGVLVVLALPYCLDCRDIALPPELREPFELGRFVRSFWVSPREHPDFGWAWVTRFLMNLGNALLILYLLYYLKDAVGLTDEQAEDGVFVLTACTASAPCSPPSSAASGRTGSVGARSS